MKQILKEIERCLPQALASDRAAIRRAILRLSRNRPDETGIKAKAVHLEKRLAESIQRKEWRRANAPQPKDNSTLPITPCKNEIIEAINRHRVVVISGETGSGKTTQIPKFCLAAGRGIDGLIGCTQPRRISAITVSQRIAEELGEKPGCSVGYKIRFQDHTRPEQTFIKIMTDGILLAETLGDPYLSAYDTLIVDEAHERSLNIDFILGILKNLTKKRDDLKVIITSATIDTQKFSQAFEGAPIIEVSGRMYPVEIRYAGSEAENGPEEEESPAEQAASAADEICHAGGRGDILIFMPTEKDIRDTCELLKGRRYKNSGILPLYARLPAQAQSLVFKPTRTRKIIVATNVAETSITIPGIKYVIDTGLARISQYSPRSRTTSLPVVPVSQSSADQRAGRCGRVTDGICIRLFSETDYTARPRFTPPEILRANLAEVILRMIALNLGDIASFPFIDRPAVKSIQDGIDLLFELGGIEEKGKRDPRRGGRYRLTSMGRLMAKIPLDPRLSRILLEAQKRDCLAEAAVLVSVLSIQDPRERPAEKLQTADQMHRTFNDPGSDFVAFLNLWEAYQNLWDPKKGAAANIREQKRFCQAHFLSLKRMREWQDIHTQVISILEEQGMLPKKRGFKLERQAGSPDPFEGPAPLLADAYERLHKSILSGLLSNIALKQEKYLFQGTKGKQVMIFPGSGLFQQAGTWIVAAEMVATTRLFARTVANIDNSWIEELASGQCQYAYTHPRWDERRQTVVADEQVRLYGLVIIPQRTVPYAGIDRPSAANVFIAEALVSDRLKGDFPFLTHNRNLIREIIDLENRTRRRDLLVGEDEMVRFYQERLKDVYDLKTLRSAIKKRGGDDFLKMSKEDLLLTQPDEAVPTLFPDRVAFGEHAFKCAYEFEPEGDKDGVTVKIPSDLVPVVSPDRIDWLVPGLLKEKITLLIKSLPKQYRKRLVPIATHAELIASEITTGNEPLITSLGRFIYQRFGIDIPAGAWQEEGLPDYLKMRISIQDPAGNELAAGRDKQLLRRAVSGKVNETEFESARQKWEQSGIKRWDFGDLPESVPVKGASGTNWILYPALAEDPQNTREVCRILLHQKEEAVEVHKKGVSRLFCNHFAQALKLGKKTLQLPKERIPEAAYFGGKPLFEKRLYESLITDLFYRDIRREADFYVHAEKIGAQGVYQAAEAKLKQILPLLAAHHKTRRLFTQLEGANCQNRHVLDFVAGRRNDLALLVPENFLSLYANERLEDITRYVQAIGIRSERGLLNLEKDQARAAEVAFYDSALKERLQNKDHAMTPEKQKGLEEFFWMLEEYKISLFAQELGTRQPISKKRLDTKLREIDRIL